MKRAQEITLRQDGYTAVFCTRLDGGLDVDVTNSAGKKVLEWTYGMISVPKLTANALFWMPQAIVQAKHEEKKNVTANSR